MKIYTVILIISALTFFNTILVGFILYTPILKYFVFSQKALRKGNEMRDFYLKLPVPLDFRIYFFNITNPSEVQDEGKKPILQEIGPYCFDAYKEKINVTDNEEEDTLTYNPYDTYFFNQMRSGNFSQDDYVTILNPLIVGMINAVSVTQPRFLGVLEKALKALFKEEYSIYITAKVREILFEGIRINCQVSDFSAKAVCSQLKTQAPVIEIEKDIYLFSLFGSRNGTSPTQITVLRGIENGDDIGKVVAINNEPKLSTWPDDECNKYKGTDGWVFPSFLKKEDGIDSFAVDLCRNFKAVFVNDTKYHGASVRTYYANLGDMSTNPEEKCYCPAPDNCLPKGVMDLTKCLKVPIYVTLPHFLETDPKLLEEVEGLSPDMDQHSIKILFEPITGTPVLGKRRIQFNLKLQRFQKISIMNNVTEVIHPILWLEEGVELEGKILKKVTTPLILLKIATGLKYLCLLAAIEGIAYGCYKHYKNSKKTKITPVQPVDSTKNSTTEQSSASSTKSPLTTLKNFASKHESLALQTVNQLTKKEGNGNTNGIAK